MEADLIFEIVEESEELEFDLTEAALKPEQEKTVTPIYDEPLEVLPDAGKVLSKVTVEPIPEPTEIEDITENGDHHVERIGIARVNVQPNLQTVTVTPTKQQQVVEPGQGYDGLRAVTVEPIPEPEMPEEYAIGGSLFAKTLISYKFGDDVTAITQPIFSGCNKITYLVLPDSITSLCANCFSELFALEQITLSNGLTEIKNNAFYRCRSLIELEIPDGVTVISDYMCSACDKLQRVKMPKSVATIWSRSFQSCKALQCLDFSESESIPTYSGSNMLYDANPNVKIVVPDSLVTAWKSATNWITYADKIIGVSDYDNG